MIAAISTACHRDVGRQLSAGRGRQQPSARPASYLVGLTRLGAVLFYQSVRRIMLEYPLSTQVYRARSATRKRMACSYPKGMGSSRQAPPQISRMCKVDKFAVSVLYLAQGDVSPRATKLTADLESACPWTAGIADVRGLQTVGFLESLDRGPRTCHD